MPAMGQGTGDTHPNFIVRAGSYHRSVLKVQRGACWDLNFRTIVLAMVQRTSWGVFRYVDFKVRKPTGRLVWQSLRCRHCWLVWELRRMWDNEKEKWWMSYLDGKLDKMSSITYVSWSRYRNKTWCESFCLSNGEKMVPIYWDKETSGGEESGWKKMSSVIGMWSFR